MVEYLFGFFVAGLDGLVQRAIGAIRDTDGDDFSVDFHFALLKIDVPATTSSSQRVATVVSADGSFAGDGTISGHSFTSRV